jgi:hypothetical protein
MLSVVHHRPWRSVLLLNALSLVVAGSAFAQSRTWVSGTGDDLNPCSRTAPCKTFAGAISKTAANGVINVLDPGSFGAVTITKGIAIESDGALAGILATGTNGIIVNAGADDVVVLRGLAIEGGGSGLRGIHFIAGKALHVDRCTLRGFTQPAINFEPTGSAQLFVRDSIVRGNGPGIQIKSTSGLARASIERTTVDGNAGGGIRVLNNASVELREVTSAGNTANGLLVKPTAGATSVSADASTFAGNGSSGITAGGGGGTAIVRLSNSSIVGNQVGIDIDPGGSVLSFGNNRIADNVSSDPPSSSIPLQ